MENYDGIKFATIREDGDLQASSILDELNHWAWILSQLGLTPLHPQGAYGNLSCRLPDNGFLVTKSGMVPSKKTEITNFCKITGCEPAKQGFRVRGRCKPSSETPMHHLIYESAPAVGAIFHGHSALLLDLAPQLSIPVTERFYPYGTVQMAESARDMVVHKQASVFILREHGFVVTAATMEAAGRNCLGLLKKLIDSL